MQGDILAIVDASGSVVAQYAYDAWGSVLSVTGTLASTVGAINPFRYRGYYYDTETKLYYLNSRYYDPEVGRFINADDIQYLGENGDFVNYNLFAYCGNNPVMGYDPEGTWDWGGVILGLSIIAVAVVSIATFGVGIVGAIAAAAAITTGGMITTAAATDSETVIDLSVSVPTSSNTYTKYGVSFIIDFDTDEVNFYTHVGGGIGKGEGFSYSVGTLSNYSKPSDYSKHFFNVNAGYKICIDHGWDPTTPYDKATRSNSLSFSSGLGYGEGYDYYSEPKKIFSW